MSKVFLHEIRSMLLFRYSLSNKIRSMAETWSSFDAYFSTSPEEGWSSGIEEIFKLWAKEWSDDLKKDCEGICSSTVDAFKDLKEDINSEIEPRLKAWKNFLRTQHENAIHENNEIWKLTIFTPNDINTRRLWNSTAWSADFKNSEVIDALAENSNVLSIVTSHTHPLNNQLGRSNISAEEINTFRKHNKSIHLPPSSPDLMNGVLLWQISKAGYKVPVTEVVFDGTWMWIFRKITSDDYYLFPEITTFNSKLQEEKVSFYGTKYEDSSPIKVFLSESNSKDINYWYNLISHKYPNKSDTKEKKQAIWSYLYNLDGPDWEANRKHLSTLYDDLSDVGINWSNWSKIFRRQVRWFKTKKNLDYLQDNFARKSASWKLTQDDFKEILLQYASVGALVSYVPKEMMYDLPLETNPAVWMKHVNWRFL